MRNMMNGFTGWASMKKTDNESVRVLDSALTVAATLLVAVTWAVLRG